MRWIKCGSLSVEKTNNGIHVPSHSQIVIKDYALALFVFSLVVIDVLILGIFTLVEVLRGELGVTRTTNKENMEDTIGVCTTDVSILLMSYFHLCSMHRVYAVFGRLSAIQDVCYARTIARDNATAKT